MAKRTVATKTEETAPVDLASLVNNAVASALADSMVKVTVARANALPPIKPLSAREVEVLEAIVDGLETNALADRLMISRETVKNHMNSLFAKTQCNNRTMLAVWALRTGTVR